MAGENIDHKALEHLSQNSQLKANKILRDHDMGSEAITKVMIERGLLPDGVEFKDKAFVWVDYNIYFSKFNDEDIDAAMAESSAMRRDRVQYFIDAMVDVASFPIHLTADNDNTQFIDRDTNLHDYYSELIREYSKIYTPRNPLQRRRDQKACAVAVNTSQAN